MQTKDVTDTPSNGSKRRPLWAWAIGIICGAELVLAAVIGGAGVSAFFGREAALVAAIAVFLLGSAIAKRPNRHTS